MMSMICLTLAWLAITNVYAFDRIVGGTAVTVDKYPFIVSINGQCGGSILRKTYPAVVITAAHCKVAFDSPSDYVRLYSNDVGGSNADSFDSAIDRYVIHPNYQGNSNDIALLFLKEDISSNTKVQTVSIDSHSVGSECCSSGDDLQVIGYGTDCSGCGLTPTLEFVDVDYVDRASCAASYAAAGATVDNTMNCAAMTNSDSCQGDSGGPLIKKGTNKQVGVVSWGIGCAHASYPGVYADLSIYYNWIIQEISSTDNTITVHNTQFINIGSKLFKDQKLNTNEALVSLNRRYVAAMQSDGNFVIYDLENWLGQIALWATNTWQHTPIARFMMYQSDGNFVLYDAANWSPKWASHTHGTTVGFVVMQNDGNLVVYDQSGVPRWASNTWQSAAIFYGGWLVGILIVINIIYMMFYCYKNKMRSKKGAGYKVVSIDSTDCDEDGIDIENRILVNNK